LKYGTKTRFEKRVPPTWNFISKRKSNFIDSIYNKDHSTRHTKESPGNTWLYREKQQKNLFVMNKNFIWAFIVVGSTLLFKQRK
jgi:hypothetical protein